MALLLVSCLPQPAMGQEEGRRRACTLVLEPTTEATRSVSIEVGEELYRTHWGGGLRWTCGDARMTADSAVRYDVERRILFVGNVDYRDSTRTLTADTVLYHERSDRLEADGRARLRRLLSGSTLEAPHVDFVRVSGDSLRRTVATGRALLTLSPEEGRDGEEPPPAADSPAATPDSLPAADRLPTRPDSLPAATDTTGAPTEIEADRIEMLGDVEAFAWGEVRIRRPDLVARADSAEFHSLEGTGVLYGSPEVEGDRFRLTGRVIRTWSSGDRLEAVEAEEEARASGEGFRLFARRIRGRMAESALDRLWAYGEGRSVGYSPPYRLESDSMAFVFLEGRLDSLDAVGTARAVEVPGDSLPDRPLPSPPLTPEAWSWVAADTLTLAFEPAVASGAPERAVSPVPPPPVPGGGPEEAENGEGNGSGEETELRRLRARGDARAYYLLREEDGAGPPGRHYQKGRSILVHFVDGRAERLEGSFAIGVHLDPLPAAGGGGAPSRGTAPRDTARGGTP